MATTLERLQYGFDRDSRRTWRRCALATGQDNSYGYDGLSQVVREARGNLNLNQTAISAVPLSQESWQYDSTGNWRGYETQVNANVALAQHRVHDKGNRLTQIEDDPNPTLLDRAGRMRQIPPDASGNWDESLELKWDAWGRITQVKRVGEAATLGKYTYDGLTRRITRELEEVVQHSYYSDEWRPLEERKDAETLAYIQYHWGARHRDDLVRRNRDADDDGDLDETRYVLMDYFSSASIVDEDGVLKERYAFSAFGIRRVLAPDFSPRPSSECAWEFGFQGQFLDTESGLLNYGFRYYSPYLGRWTAKDPIGAIGGLNIYAASMNNLLNKLDRFGLGPDDCCKTEQAAAKAAITAMEAQAALALKAGELYEEAIKTAKNLAEAAAFVCKAAALACAKGLTNDPWAIAACILGMERCYRETEKSEEAEEAAEGKETEWDAAKAEYQERVNEMKEAMAAFAECVSQLGKK